MRSSVPGRSPTPHHRIGRDVLWGLTAILTLDLFARLEGATAD